jgi:hypothetical protein
MKELIRSLTRKAGFIRLSQDKYAAITDQQIEKFAELIVSEWAGLTDEDMAELRRNGAHSVSDADFRAIEAKLKEKNT